MLRDGAYNDEVLILVVRMVNADEWTHEDADLAVCSKQLYHGFGPRGSKETHHAWPQAIPNMISSREHVKHTNMQMWFVTRIELHEHVNIVGVVTTIHAIMQIQGWIRAKHNTSHVGRFGKERARQ